MPYIATPSGRLEYVDLGEGVPFVMLHGGTGSIEEWGSCVDYFAKRYRVIAYNRRGYGHSTPRYTFGPDFFEEDVDDLVALTDGLGLAVPVYLCAFSDGGTIALMFAVRHPGRVKAMVCSGAHIYVDKKTVPGLGKIRQLFEDRVRRDGLEETPQVRSQRAWFDRWLHPDFAVFSIEDEISRIQCPTLVIQGTEDEYADPAHAEAIAEKISDSELWLVEGARHWVHGGKHTDAFNERVLAFFSGK